MTFDQLILNAPISITSRLEFLKTIKERPDYHPEDNTFIHIKAVTTRLIASGNPDLIASGLLHDICKGDPGVLDLTGGHLGYPTSPNHGPVAAGLIKSDIDIQNFIKSFGADIQRTADICENHMRIKSYDRMHKDKQDRFRSMDCFFDLQCFTICDKMVDDLLQPVTDDQKIKELLDFISRIDNDFHVSQQH